MARNKNRQPGPIKRTIIPDHSTRVPSGVVALHAAPVVVGTSPVTRHKRLAPSKGQGEWSVSPYYRTPATHDSRWSRTISS